MGKRREGFLTPWQWTYIKDFIEGKSKIGKSRQHVEDYYILKSWDTACDQLMDFLEWAEKSKRKVDVPLYWNAMQSFNPSPGRPTRGRTSKLYPYEQTVECPNPECRLRFHVKLYVSRKDKKVIYQVSDFVRGVGDGKP